MAQRDRPKDVSPRPLAPDARATPTNRFSLSPMRVAQALFSHQVRLTRGERGLQFVLERPEGAGPAVLPSDALPPDEVAVRRMRADLTALLDSAPGSRQVMRYLAAIEGGLKHKDARGLFLFDVGIRRLEPALRQLDGLSVEPLASGLVALRERLVDAIRTQRAVEEAEHLRQPMSSFLVDHKLEVAEARASDFDAAHATWLAETPIAPAK